MESLEITLSRVWLLGYLEHLILNFKNDNKMSPSEDHKWSHSSLELLNPRPIYAYLLGMQDHMDVSDVVYILKSRVHHPIIAKYWFSAWCFSCIWEGHPRTPSGQLFLSGIVYDMTNGFYGYGPTPSPPLRSCRSLFGCFVNWDSISVNRGLSKPH